MSSAAHVEIVDHNEGYAQEIQSRKHTWWADEPLDLEGLDSGPTPYELLLSALGSCTNITLRMYARKKEWPLEELAIKLTYEKLDDREVIHRELEFSGDLTDQQRARLLEIADRCPVHRTLMGTLEITTSEIQPSS